MYPYPAGLCVGPPGYILPLNVSEGLASGKVIEVRLHYPADVKVLVNVQEPVSGCLVYMNVVVYYPVTDPPKLKYFKLQQVVELKISKLKSRASVVHKMQRRNLPALGSVADMKSTLQELLAEMKLEDPHYKN